MNDEEALLECVHRAAPDVAPVTRLGVEEAQDARPAGLDHNLPHELGLVIGTRGTGNLDLGRVRADLDVEIIFLEQEAVRHGLRFINIQFPSAQIGPDHMAKLSDVLRTENEQILLFCRTGTRSTLLWATAQMVLGANLEEAIGKAAQAGYDLRQAAPLLEQLSMAARAGGM